MYLYAVEDVYPLAFESLQGLGEGPHHLKYIAGPLLSHLQFPILQQLGCPEMGLTFFFLFLDLGGGGLGIGKPLSQLTNLLLMTVAKDELFLPALGGFAKTVRANLKKFSQGSLVFKAVTLSRASQKDLEPGGLDALGTLKTTAPVFGRDINHG